MLSPMFVFPNQAVDIEYCGILFCDISMVDANVYVRPFLAALVLRLLLHLRLALSRTGA